MLYCVNIIKILGYLESRLYGMEFLGENGLLVVFKYKSGILILLIGLLWRVVVV